jgi:histidinol-phosphate aminotransferase
MDLMKEYPNVVVFRTFSKMYALAALRVGYLCAGTEVVDIIRRAHVVYSVNALAQMAAAAAIGNDAGFIAATRGMVAEAKTMLGAEIAKLGLEYICGEGNYMMVRLPMSDTLFYRKIACRGILIRTMTGFRFPGWIRVSLAPQPVMAEFIRAFRDILKE